MECEQVYTEVNEQYSKRSIYEECQGQSGVKGIEDIVKEDHRT